LAFLPLADVAAVARGRVKYMEAVYDMPFGVARPCNYALEADDTRVWGITLDCRAQAIADIERRMTKVANDPDTKQVSVGRRALDHARTQTLFVDEDTDCSVAVVGPDESSRLALSRLAATRLTPETAPRPPRAQRP
jgi:hypothetical protein